MKVTPDLLEFFQIEYGITLPTHYELCPACQGRGTMTLKRLAIPQEMFDEDPDFAEDYWGGVYDEPCDLCDGRTSILAVDEERLTDDAAKVWQEYIQDMNDLAAMEAAERRAGC